MRVGVIYLWHPKKRMNGTLFYCAEYYAWLRSHTTLDVQFYIVGTTSNDLEFIERTLMMKYHKHLHVTPIKKLTDLHTLKLDRTLILDIRTFHYTKEFLTNDIHVFANEPHESFRYKNDRTVTYYGSYDYQNYDVFNYLKLNFEIFPPITEQQNAVLVTSPNHGLIQRRLKEYQERFGKPIFVKTGSSGYGNIFEMIDHVHYVHTSLDTNNRTIPEAFFYDTPVTIDEEGGPKDSVFLRYWDIQENGLKNYTLTSEDEMVKACLK